MMTEEEARRLWARMSGPAEGRDGPREIDEMDWARFELWVGEWLGHARANVSPFPICHIIAGRGE